MNDSDYGRETLGVSCVKINDLLITVSSYFNKHEAIIPYFWRSFLTKSMYSWFVFYSEQMTGRTCTG